MKPYQVGERVFFISDGEKRSGVIQAVGSDSADVSVGGRIRKIPYFRLNRARKLSLKEE